MSEFQKESLTLEETNRVRVSLGLKPLEDDGPKEDERTGAPVSQVVQDAISERNFEELKRSERAAADAAAVRERVEKARNRRDYNKKLEGPSLGDEGDDGSARDWLKRAAQRRRANAAKQASAESESARAQMHTPEYGAQDVTGLRVAHSMEDLGAGDHVLTLRDAGVLDNDEDELVDVHVAQSERDRINAERRQGVKPYTGTDDGEAPRGILSKYDSHEGLDPHHTLKMSESGFRIGDAPPEPPQELPDADAARKLTNMDYEKNVETSDYMPEIRFSKSGKKRRAARVKVDIDDSPAEPAVHQPRTVTTDNFVDDDEIAAALSRERRQRAKAQMTKVTPEMIKQNLAKINQTEARNNTQPEGLVFDETAEFVRTISERAKVTEVSKSEAPVHTEVAPEPAPADPEPAAAPDVDMQPAQPPTEPADTTADDDYAQALEGVREAPTEQEEAHDEPFVNSSVAAALQAVRRQGIVEQHSPDLLEREIRQKQYDVWMSERKREDQERASEPHGEMRERDRRLHDKREAEYAMERFRDYNPDINIEYHDEFGRTLTQKEAWKRLSHVFHGKAPGHKAQEKRLRRIEEERRRERLLAGDTLSGMSKAFLERSERLGQAHMVLSVGSHGNAPQDPDMLHTDVVSEPAPPPQKAAPAPRKVKKVHQKPQSEPDSAPEHKSEPDAGSAPAPVPDAPAMTAEATTAPNTSMRPAFAQTMKAAPAASPAPAAGSAPEGAPRERVRISLGKRKADS